MDLLELLAEIVEGHVEDTEIVGAELALEFLLFVVTDQFSPKGTVFATGHALPSTFPPRIT